MQQFETGTLYTMRSICDHNCVWVYRVVSRTAKTVTLCTGNLHRVTTYNGVEQISPLGKYSMSPTLRADSVAS